MNSASALIGDWLGVSPPATEAAVLEIVEGQLDPSIVQRLSDMGLSRDEVHAVIIPARTLQHRRSRNERLTIEESDRAIRAIRVFSAAEGVYESRERALQWLRRPHPRLSGRTPISLLKTDTGARIVEELLGQIDEGYFV
ncbi:MAG: antitoxin Xre/MbcA/ParS toxin-binding domain-containing protein [Terracidiphilus sp.]|jgi:putative toxin-antitoxin system antitoxin component (TIGR02293 family)